MQFAARAGRPVPGRAFTLIEVLVVVAILALLISILLPSLKRAREQARTVYCSTNLRTIGQGFYFYTQAYDSSFPGSGAWAEYIRPLLQRSLGKKSSEQRPAGDPNEYFEVEVYACPNDPEKTPTSQRVMDPMGTPVVQMILLSYAVNENVIWPLNDLNAARTQQNYSIIPDPARWLRDASGSLARDRFGEAIPAHMRRITDVRRTSDVILCTDAGDDEVGVGGPTPNTNYDRAYWDWDREWDIASGSGPEYAALEVHHQTGNNFLFVDGHVQYFKVINSAVRQGVPAVPRYWVPEFMNVSAPKP